MEYIVFLLKIKECIFQNQREPYLFPNGFLWSLYFQIQELWAKQILIFTIKVFPIIHLLIQVFLIV